MVFEAWFIINCFGLILKIISLGIQTKQESENNEILNKYFYQL